MRWVSSGEPTTKNVAPGRGFPSPACPQGDWKIRNIHILRVLPEMTSAAAAITWVNHGIHLDKFAVKT